MVKNKNDLIYACSREQDAINNAPECRQVFQLYNYPPDWTCSKDD
jgi:hypothetical protein